jgi:alpha-beta hydrolase superfamily lysophospholipase
MVENTYKVKLIEYLRKNLKKGYPVDTLRIALINQGYSRQIVDEALKVAINKMAAEAPVINEKPQIEHEVIAEEEAPIVQKKSMWKKIVEFFQR